MSARKRIDRQVAFDMLVEVAKALEGAQEYVEQCGRDFAATEAGILGIDSRHPYMCGIYQAIVAEHGRKVRAAVNLLRGAK